ncbi:translocation/assembly module TamB domain-containing protein [soil metagenome]
MTDLPPSEPAAVEPPLVEPVAKAEKRRRTRTQLAVFIAGCVAAALAVILLVGVIGGRMYLLSGPGRALVTSFVAGQKISRYGRINVEGLSGDLFSDFTLRRVTITDKKGVWLEARNVRVDWSYLPLLTRRFHADSITADVIRLVRRPEIDPPDGKPPQPAALSVDIDRFSTQVELLEGFSQEYGRWALNGVADIPRFGDKTATVNADSLSRPGDFLRLAATFGGKIEDMRLNLRASEARGGPLAGSLGYSPDQPFSALAVVNGQIANARVQTGDFVPLTIQGQYGKAGARISGFVDFGRSDLLKPFVERIGPTARFGFAAIPDPHRKDYQGVGWRFLAQNLNSNGHGMIRLSDRSVPDGLKVEVSTPSLTRLVKFTVAEATTYAGIFTGTATDWSIKGDANLSDTNLISYRSAHLAGPLNITASGGRYRFNADAQVTGGITDGVIGALMGQRPHVKGQAVLLKDGAFLFEHLDLRGQALTFVGSGSRNLIGGLGFRGQAQVTDFGKILPGGTGGLDGAVTALSPRNGAPWTLTFNGRGNRLMTHQAETDRLMGASPRLQFVGLMKGQQVEVNSAVVTGASGVMNAKGLMGFDGSLHLALDWTAHGPFGVGPIAIDGAMTGKGALTGFLAEPRTDLTAAFDKVAIGPLLLNETQMILTFRKGVDNSDGRMTLSSGSNYGPATASGTFFLEGNAIRLTDVDLNAGGVTAQGAISLSDNTPSSADMTFRARPGAFLASGSAEGRVRLLDGGGDGSAIVDITARNAKLAGSTYVIRNLDLKGQGTLANLPFTLSTDIGGDIPVQFNGSGVYSRIGTDQRLTLRGGGRVREIAFTTRSPVMIALAGDGQTARVDLAVGGGVLVGDLRQDARGASIQAQLTAVELGSIAPDLRGQITGRVSLNGQGSTLAGAANVTLNQIRSIDAPRGVAVDGTLNATLSDNTLHIIAQANDAAVVRASADVTLPVETSAAPLRLAIVRTRPMSGQVDIDGQIQPIWDLFMGGERSMSGQIVAKATLGGSIAEPRINGRMDVSNGDFRDNFTGVRLAGLSLASRFDDTTALIEAFNANDGSGGTVRGDGRIGLREGSGSSFETTLTRFRIIDNDIAEARASGPVTVVRGTDGNITLTGRIDIDEARIQANPPGENGVVRMDVIEVNRPGGDITEAEQVAHRGPQFGLNIQLRSPHGDVRVIGRGLNVEMNVNAQVGGTIAEPTLTGNAGVVRGDYEFAGKRFVFDDRGSVSLSTDPNLIRLNLSAVRDDPTLTATIKVTGTAASPKIELTSVPSLPQDEILSQVLFGRSASQLSGFEAAQLAAGVASLAGGGGFDVIGNLRELAGLDRLSFGGQASALTVSGGRYLTDNVYLEVIGGGESGAAVNVEWQVRRNLAISSKFGGTGEATLSVRWRRSSRQPGARSDDRRPNR